MLDEKTAYVRDIVKHVAVVNLATGKTEKIINVGNGHAGIDVSPDGPHGVRAGKDSHWIYVTVSKDNVVAVINALTMKVEKKIAVGQFPFWVAVTGNP